MRISNTQYVALTLIVLVAVPMVKSLHRDIVEEDPENHGVCRYKDGDDDQEIEVGSDPVRLESKCEKVTCRRIGQGENKGKLSLEYQEIVGSVTNLNSTFGCKISNKADTKPPKCNQPKVKCPAGVIDKHGLVL